MCEHFLVGRRSFVVALCFALELAQHDELVRLRRSLCPIDFQIAQHKRALAVLLKKNKRIADKNARRVEHIGIGIAWRNDKTGGLILFCHEIIVGQRFLAANVSSRRLLPFSETAIVGQRFLAAMGSSIKFVGMRFLAAIFWLLLG